MKIITTGVPAHSSNPANGRSAISDMVRVIRDLETGYIAGLEQTHPLTGKAQCSINQIAGGRQANMIPDRCEIVIDRRLLPGESLDDLLPAIEARLASLRDLDPAFRANTEVLFEDPPMSPLQMDRTMEFLRPALEAHGLRCEPRGVPYGTDASNLTAAGIPAVVLGPGDIRQAHTADEWIDLEQLLSAVSLYSAIMRRPLPR